jgi:hypothetical protein
MTKKQVPEWNFRKKMAYLAIFEFFQKTPFSTFLKNRIISHYLVHRVGLVFAIQNEFLWGLGTFVDNFPWTIVHERPRIVHQIFRIFEIVPENLKLSMITGNFYEKSIF